jgi:hypothetical protein
MKGSILYIRKSGGKLVMTKIGRIKIPGFSRAISVCMQWRTGSGTIIVTIRNAVRSL